MKSALKKLIVFSSENVRKIIENYVADEAECDKRSASSLIENHVLNDILPQNDSAKMFVQSMYNDSAWSETKCLENIFSFLAAGINGNAKYENGLPFVQFAAELSTFRNYKVKPERREIHHFLSSFGSVIEKLEINKINTEWAKELLKESKDKNFPPQAAHIFQLVTEHWEILGNYTYTYRMMFDLMAMQDGAEASAELRLKLAKIIKEVSAEWKN